MQKKSGYFVLFSIWADLWLLGMADMAHAHHRHYCPVQYLRPQQPPTDLALPQPKYIALQPKLLCLQDAVMLSLRSNPAVRGAYLQRVIDKFALVVAKNEFEPQYGLTGGATYQNGSVAIYTTNPTIGIKTPYGTQLNLGVNNTITGGINNSTATLTASQPLLRNFGRIPTETALYNAVQGEKLAKLTLKQTVITTIVQVVQQYSQVVQDYQNLETNQISLKESITTLNQIVARINAGKAPRTDRIQQEAQVASQRLAVVQQQNTIAQDYQNFLILLGLDPNAKLDIDTNLQVDPEAVPNKARSIELALANNIAYQQALIGYEMAKRALLVAADQQKWELNATASFSKNIVTNDLGGITPNSNSTTTINPTTGIITTTTTTTGVTGDGTSKSLGLTLSIPIDDVPRRQQIINAKIELQKNRITLEQQKLQVITDVTNGYRNLQAQLQQIQLSINTVKLAQQSLNIERMKYVAGRSTLVNVTNLQNTLIQQMVTLTGQKIQYLNTLEQFYQTLGTTLERWCLTLVY